MFPGLVSPVTVPGGTRGGGFRYRISLRYTRSLFFAPRASEMRRVHQEAFFSTECIFRIPGGPLLYRMPTTSIHSTPQHKTKEVPTECYFNRDFRKAAAAYSPTWWGSTIGASELNFSVRYGKRWFLTAITAAVCYLREISWPEVLAYSKDLGLLVQVD